GRLELRLDRRRIGDALTDEERGRAGDVRRRHRGAVEDTPDLALVLAVLADGLLRDADARRADGDLRSARREPRDVVVLVRRADGDDAGVARGVADAATRVARGRDDDDALLHGVIDGLLDDRALLRRAEREVDDLRAVVGRPTDALRDVGHRSPALGGEDLDRHQLRAMREARDADAVVRRLRDRAGHVR